MTTVRIILVALLAVGLTVLATLNWQTVSLSLGGDLMLDIKLPVLVAAIVLLVAVPMWLFGFARRTLLERRIEKLKAQLERAEADLAQARIELLRPPARAAGADGSPAGDAAPAAPGPPLPAAPDTEPQAAPGAPPPGLPPQAIPQAAPPPGA